MIEAHRVLRWTYVFGYYLDNPSEKSLFEFLQEDLEKNCDHLHELVEAPLTPFYGVDPVRCCAALLRLRACVRTYVRVV